MTINRIGPANPHHPDYMPVTNLNRADEATADCCNAGTTAGRFGQLINRYVDTIAQQAEQIDSLVCGLAACHGVDHAVIRVRFGLDQ